MRDRERAGHAAHGLRRLDVDAQQRVDRELEAVHAVHREQLERGRGGALLRVAADAEALLRRAAVDQLVDRRRVAVEVEDHGLVVGEQLGERRLVHPVRMRLGPRQREQVGDADEAHLQVGRVLAQQVGGGQQLDRRDRAAAGEHDVRIAVSSLDANSQTVAPCSTCSRASSIDSHCGSGCFEAITRLIVRVDWCTFSIVASSVFASGGR